MILTANYYKSLETEGITGTELDGAIEYQFIPKVHPGQDTQKGEGPRIIREYLFMSAFHLFGTYGHNILNLMNVHIIIHGTKKN